jgi:hypothetical protein
MPSEAGSLEGDGWVNWSGLATLVADLEKAINSSLNDLLPSILAVR